MKKNKKGQMDSFFVVASSAVAGVIGLILLIIIGYVFVQNLTTSSILTANSLEANSSTNLRGNFTTLGNNIATNISTLGTIVGVILVIGAILILYVYARKSGVFSSGGGSY